MRTAICLRPCNNPPMPTVRYVSHRLFALALLLALGACGTVPVVTPGLPAAFARAMQEADIPPSAVTLRIQDLEDGVPLVTHNARTAFQPASIMKLVTTQAALELLGPDYRWTTRFYTNGVQSGEVLQGPLIIQGSGDPRLAQEDLWRTLRHLRALGVREIGGGLVFDRSRFQTMPENLPAFDAQPDKPYNALPDALLLDAKAVNLRLMPDTINRSVTVFSEPALYGVAVIAPTMTGGDCGDWRRQLGLVQEASVLRFTGSYAASCAEQRLAIHLSQLNHVQYFEAELRQIWSELGGSISGVTREGSVPSDARLLLQWQSMPLSEVIRDMNKNSNNVMARQLLLSMEAEHGQLPATPEAASLRVSKWLAMAKIENAGFVMENGSGLSRTERVSALGMAQLLRRAWRWPTMPEFLASLPIAGVDGTMSRRVQSLGVAGHAHIKTGTLAEVVSIAGYVTARSGRRLSVVCMVNHANANSPAMRKGIDAMLESVFENN